MSDDENPRSSVSRFTGGRRLGAAFFALLALDVALWRFLDQSGPGRFRDVGDYFAQSITQWSLVFALVFATFSLFGSGTLSAVTLAFRYARGAVAGSARDPVIRVRDFFRRHPRLRALLPWLPTLAASPLLALAYDGQDLYSFDEYAAQLIATPHHIAVVAGFLATGALSGLFNRFALRGLDGIRDRESATVTTVDRDETSFQAVAVTARTQGAVAGMLALTVAMIYGVGQSHHFWMRDALHGLPLVGYAVAALGFAAWFRKASTIAVGRDGIFVRGTSKERFFSYQDFDEVRLAGMHFDFHRKGTRVLRLQLHGTDDARAEALAERIRAALAASRRTDGAHLLAQSVDGGALGRAVQGASDYRQPSVTREQLWELVEGEATDRGARLAAATALAAAGDTTDRTRLRVAAAHVADPRVRVTLEDLADDGGPENATENATDAATRLQLPVRAS